MSKLRLAVLDHLELPESNDYWVGFGIGAAIVLGVGAVVLAVLMLLAA